MAQTKAKTDMIVWKKAIREDGRSNYCLVKLRIKKGTRINLCKSDASMNGRKCRAESAKVISLHNMKGVVSTLKACRSRHDRSFSYAVGKKLMVRKFNTSAAVCASGIHFFVNRIDAVKYCL